MTLAERIVTVIAAACASCSATVRGPVPVTLAAPMTVNATMKPRPACWVPTPPSPPELSSIDSDNPDVIGRVMIHRREYAEMVAYAKDTAEWMTQVRDCLEHWSETP